VTYRYAPLVTAGYGTRVARPVRTASFARGGNGSQLSQRVRPVPGDSGLLGTSPEGSRQIGRRLNLSSLFSPRSRESNKQDGQKFCT
jgi:hypothetical protein